MSNEYHIIAKKGQDLNLRFVARNTEGDLVDLTQYAVQGHVRLKYSDTGILLDLNPTIDSTYISGIIDVRLDINDLADLPITQAFYDIKVYHIDGYSDEIVQGYFNIAPAVTV